MATLNKKPDADRGEMLAPVTALTRFHPDTSSLSNLAGRQVEYTRQGVQIGATGILLPYLEKVEIVELQSVCPIPNTPMWFMGIINNRGNLLPVFELKMYMAMDADRSSRWMMILGQGGKAAGLCIDTLPAAIDNPQQVDIDWADKQQSAFAEVLRPFITAMFMHDGKLWADMSYDKLFHELGTGF